MLETKWIVAPNSPSACAKDRLIPSMMPGTISGSVTVRNTQAGLAPSVPAASSSRRSTASIERRTARTINGNPMTAERSEEHTSEVQSLMRISYAVFCLKKKQKQHINHTKAAHMNRHKITSHNNEQIQPHRRDST